MHVCVCVSQAAACQSGVCKVKPCTFVLEEPDRSGRLSAQHALTEIAVAVAVMQCRLKVRHHHPPLLSSVSARLRHCPGRLRQSCVHSSGEQSASATGKMAKMRPDRKLQDGFPSLSGAQSVAEGLRNIVPLAHTHTHARAQAANAGSGAQPFMLPDFPFPTPLLCYPQCLISNIFQTYP